MDLDKADARRDAELNGRTLELRDIKNTFDMEGRRLD